jgi:hypothetical protein
LGWARCIKSSYKKSRDTNPTIAENVDLIDEISSAQLTEGEPAFTEWAELR